MQEDEFEKQVQKKMDQLEFDPSDSVWSGVDRAVNGEKKRRRPLFWLFFLAAPVAVATGYLYFNNLHSGNTKSFHAETPADSALAKQRAGEAIPNTDLGKIQSFKKPISSPNLASEASVSPGPTSKNARSGYKNGTTLTNYPTLQMTGASSEPDSKKIKPSTIIPEARDGAEMLPVEKKTELNAAPADSSVHTLGEQVKRSSTGDSASLNSIAKAKNNKVSSWSFGITGSLGISGINQGLFQQSYSNTYFAPVSGSSGSGGAVATSKVNSDFSFSIGGFVGKMISDRFSVSGGLNYHYYSTKINIQDVNGYPAYNTTFNPAVVYAPAGFSTGSNTRSYTNQYHFIELPVLADFRLNKSKQVPVIWEAGFSFAYLVSTNALYFDPAANIYYKNTQLFNKAQWNASTAILIGLSVNKSQLLIGPQVQYGLSGLLKNTATSPQHFLSYGLKISFIPNKK